MKSKDQLLLEQAYASIISNSTNETLRALIAEDHRLIDELIEEGFGDYLKKVGGAIKGGVQKAASKIKETLTSGLASTLIKAIISVVPKEELENMINIVAKGQVPKDKVEQVKELIAKQPDGEAPVKESYISTKEYLASTLFTEANVLLALENANGLLVEAKSGRELQKFAKDVASKINELYPKNKKAMAAAIPKFTDTVSKYLGLLPQSRAQAPTQAPAQAPAQAAEQSPANNNNAAPAATSPSSAPESGSSSGSSSSSNASNEAGAEPPSNPSTMDNVKGAVNNAVNNVENKIPTGKGLVSKVMGFVKAHPKISSVAGAVLLGVVVAAFAGSAPVVVPALIAAVKGAGIVGTSSIVKQMISGEKVDLKQAGKTALVGGALGGVGSVLATGLGNIASSVMGMFSGGSGASAQSHAPANAAPSGANTEERRVSNTSGFEDSGRRSPGVESKTWTSPDAAEYDEGEDMMQPYTRQQSEARVKEIAKQLGLNPNNVDYQLKGSVPASINGRDVTKFLTPDEKEMVNAAKQVASEMQRSMISR